MNVITRAISERSRGSLDVAFEVGQFCYLNDEPCPYRRDQDVAEWHRGWTAASQRDHHNPDNRKAHRT